ncbi:MAG: universal stress protein [Hyphomicrobiales bacterium]|nr:universal stress protein [Hyphomicrobiales bacterium]
MPSRLRRSFEEGHRPKFLVVIDETAECSRAVRFAARRVLRLQNAVLLMISVTDPPDGQHWLGVGDIMREEADARANALMEAFVWDSKSLGPMEVERVLRSGKKAEEIVKLINEDVDISFLVLASGTGSEGPGPLVSRLAARGDFPIPVVVVPGALSDAEIDAIA